MKKINLLISLLLLLPYYAFANGSEPAWETIFVEPEFDIIDDKGKTKTIHPACAFDTIITPDDNSFRFYFKPGKNDKLVVYFNGGGACWDNFTCATSLLNGQPTYNPTVLQENDPNVAGGIFDETREENPFKDWNKVFIPYCTGDIHVGSKDITYVDYSSGAPIEVKVKHHGFDNFLAVREWLKTEFSTKKEEKDKTKWLKKFVVTGGSAGGYGATLNFPYLQDTFPNTKAVLLADASEGIVTQGFLDTAFSDGGNWGVENTLTPIFAKDLNYRYENWNAEIFTILTSSYPDNRFAQYTTAFDTVQVQFFQLMNVLDGAYDPTVDYSDLWNEQMELSLDGLAYTTDNYQYYIGAGSIHMVLIDAYAPDGAELFYDENSAEGVWFTDWVKRLVNGKKFHEENLKYSN